MPIGLRTITKPIDDFFDEKLDSASFKKSKAFLAPYVVKYNTIFITTYQSDLQKFKSGITADLTNYHPNRKKTAEFVVSNTYSQAANPEEIIILVLQEFGPGVLRNTLPL